MRAVLFASIFPVLLYLIRLRLAMSRTAYQKANSIAKLDKDLWKLFSKYTRIKDADFKGYVACFTCHKQDDHRLMDAGHYIPKATSGSYLKFYEKNVHPQCQDCNRLKHGNYAVYKGQLILKYGAGIIEELNLLRSHPPLTLLDYKEKIRHYSNQLKIINSK